MYLKLFKSFTFGALEYLTWKICKVLYTYIDRTTFSRSNWTQNILNIKFFLISGIILIIKFNIIEANKVQIK